jgi:hypothetical protein
MQIRTMETFLLEILMGQTVRFLLLYNSSAVK